MKKILISLVIIPVSITYCINNLPESLGRDKDPKTVSDLSKFKLFVKKSIWETLSLPGMRFMVDRIFPESTISYLEIEEKVVAFTVDDGFCGRDNPNGDMTDEVLGLFKNYESKATFFTSGSHCNHTSYESIKKLLDDGHELANHSMYDFPYNKHSEIEFENDFDSTHAILKIYDDDISKWYRSPHAKLSQSMQKILDKKGYKHIMCDGFANDTSIPDPKWISSFILKKIKNGSIILIHMPEKGFREWNLEAMELTLKGLKEKEFKVVTVSELYDIYDSD